MIVKKYLKLFLFLILGFFIVSSAAFAESGAKNPNCAFTWTFYSNYIWQGLELSESNPFLFPSVFKGYNQALIYSERGDFDSGYSDPFSWDSERERLKRNRVLSYQDSFFLTDETALNCRLGWLNYDAKPGKNENLFAGFGLNTLLSPEVSVLRGMGFKEDAWSINFALSQNWDLSKYWPKVGGWTLGLGSGLSYLDFDNVNYDDWQNANVWADLNIPFNDGCSLTPSINYSFPVNDVRRNMVEDGSYTGLESSFVFGGVSLEIPF